VSSLAPGRPLAPDRPLAPHRSAAPELEGVRPPELAVPATISGLAVPATIAAIVALCALVATIGSDARWLAPLGDVIFKTGSVPSGIPFAAAATSHWSNSLVLAELVFALLEWGQGDRGLMIAQLVAVGIAMTSLARDARVGGAGERTTTRMLVIVALGAAPALAIVRVQLFSIALFPVVCAMLRADARNPSARIWLVIPVLALWSNLHGAALLGLAVVCGYLALSRARRQPLLAASVALVACASLLLTPAGIATIGYYHGLLTNVAAQRGDGMWGALSLSAPFDVILIGAALALAFTARRARPAPWELAVALALALMTVQASRNGVWLLFFLTPLAARGARERGRSRLTGLAPVAALAAACLLCVAIARGPVPRGASANIVAQAITAARGGPVLANDEIDEQVAEAGGRIWAGDPIDAFSRTDQADYLDFVDGDRGALNALPSAVRVVLVTNGSASQQLLARAPQFKLDARDSAASLYVRAGQ
jgi:hypothetical protein